MLSDFLASLLQPCIIPSGSLTEFFLRCPKWPYQMLAGLKALNIHCVRQSFFVYRQYVPLFEKPELTFFVLLYSIIQTSHSRGENQIFLNFLLASTNGRSYFSYMRFRRDKIRKIIPPNVMANPISIALIYAAIL